MVLKTPQSSPLLQKDGISHQEH